MTGHGELHYREDTVARVMGPTTLGQWLICYHAEYNPTTDVTTAHLRPATPDELKAAS